MKLFKPRWVVRICIHKNPYKSDMDSLQHLKEGYFFYWNARKEKKRLSDIPVISVQICHIPFRKRHPYFPLWLSIFGGGYAMLSMIQGEVVTRYGWVSSQEFTDIVAISQMTPGPIGINAATYVGFTSTGSVWGSIIATFAVVLPSFILMLTISKFFLKYQKHPVVESVFSGLRPAVVGLLASAALVLMNVENFGSPTKDTYTFVVSVIIFLIAFVGTKKYKANPILMIIACGIAGLILY